MGLIKPSLPPMLDAVATALSPPLIEAKARAQLRLLAEQLPCFSDIGFECHMALVPARVDLIVGVDFDPEEVHPLLVGTAFGRRLVECRLGGQGGYDQAVRCVDRLYFEFDVPPNRAVPRPAVFVGLLPEAGTDGATVASLAQMIFGDLRPATAAALGRAVAATGDGVRVTHLGAMESRANRSLRVNFGAASAAAVLRQAVALAIPEDQLTALRQLLDLGEPYARHFVLAVDIAGSVLPRLGIECYTTSPGSVEEWRGFLSHLVRADLCSAAEAEAVLRWPGQAPPPASPVWSEARCRLGQFLGHNQAGALIRTINHVKLAWEPGAKPYVKAYLFASQLWFDDGRV